MKNIHIITLLLLFLIPQTGCGKKIPNELPPLYFCSVTVTMDNQPLQNGLVYLKTETYPNIFASGITDTAGTAVLQTNGQYSGVPEGHYKVTIEKMASDPNWKPKNQWDKEQLKNVVHEKYSIMESSPLECHVKKGNNQLKFEVEASN
jgi:predicted small lipoprotein YifL